MSLTADYLQAARVSVNDILPKIKSQATSLTICAASVFALAATSAVLEGAPQETTDKPTEWFTSEYPHETPIEPKTIVRGQDTNETVQYGGLPYVYAASPTLTP